MGQAIKYVKFRHKEMGWLIEVNAALPSAVQGFREMEEYEELPDYEKLLE
jgi:hypothetical protein